MVGKISGELALFQGNLEEKQREIAQTTDSCKTRMESLQEQRQQLPPGLKNRGLLLHLGP